MSRAVMHHINRQNLVFNAFFGAIGSTINTAELLLAQLDTSNGLTVENIKNFQVFGSNNVSCFIDTPYGLGGSTVLGLTGFSNNQNLTYLIGGDNFSSLAGARILQSSSNIKFLHAAFATLWGFAGAQGALSGMTRLKKINVENIGFSQGRNTLSGASIKLLNLKTHTGLTLINLGYQAFQSLSSLERLNIKNVVTMSISYITNSFFNNINTNCKIYYNSELGAKDRRAFNYVSYNSGVVVGDSFTLNGLVYTASNSNDFNNGSFDISSNNANTIGANISSVINNDTRTGSFSKVFSQASLGNLGLYVDALGVIGNSVTVQNTNNTPLVISNSNFIGGFDIHKNLIYLRDEKSCALVECFEPITVNPPTNLSVSNITSNSVQLNFSEPAPNANGTDAYEVWVEDSTIYRKLFEYDEILASGNTLDLTEIVDDIGSISGIKIKIRTIDGQFNYSPFSNEITL